MYSRRVLGAPPVRLGQAYPGVVRVPQPQPVQLVQQPIPLQPLIPQAQPIQQPPLLAQPPTRASRV